MFAHILYVLYVSYKYNQIRTLHYAKVTVAVTFNFFILLKEGSCYDALHPILNYKWQHGDG